MRGKSNADAAEPACTLQVPDSSKSTGPKVAVATHEQFL